MYISGQVLVKAHSIGDMVVIFILFHFLVIAAEPVYASNESQPQMVVVTQPLPQVLVVNYHTLKLYYSTAYYVVHGGVHISHHENFMKKLAAYCDPVYYTMVVLLYIFNYTLQCWF